MKHQPRLSPHDPALRPMPHHAGNGRLRPQGNGARGNRAERTAFGPGLSTAVQAAIPAAIDRVLGELRARGIEREPYEIRSNRTFGGNAPTHEVASISRRRRSALLPPVNRRSNHPAHTRDSLIPNRLLFGLPTALRLICA